MRTLYTDGLSIARLDPGDPRGQYVGRRRRHGWRTPQAIAVDPAGRLLIAEYDGERIQAVTP